MKKTIHLLIMLTVFLSCENKPKQVEKTNNTKTETKISKVNNSKYHTQKDTILITTEIGDTLKYTKETFNNIVDKHHEFFKDYTKNPDQLYFSENNDIEFDSEIGQDNYYVLYAYFLKQRNGIDEFAKQRQKLIDIYSNINSLYRHFEYGGTYFGHQSSRILGYAEYSIHLMPKIKEDVRKTYDISKQKELYIKSLRQLIEDENKIDFNTLGKEKIIQTKKLNKIVDEIDKLITDNFYLRRAQEFQYVHYEYY